MKRDINRTTTKKVKAGFSSTGMIEIVRNAVTIAAVHWSQGGTSAAFKNDALFEWLKSKGPLQEIVRRNVEDNQRQGYLRDVDPNEKSLTA